MTHLRDSRDTNGGIPGCFDLGATFAQDEATRNNDRNRLMLEMDELLPLKYF